MKLLAIGLVWAVLPALGQQPGAPVAPIQLYTQFQQQPPADVLEALRNEVDAIMAPSTLHFEWRSLKSVRGDEVSVELAVVNFKGRCDGDFDSNASGGRVTALGWTHVSDGVILPFTDIDCDSIARFLHRGLISIQPSHRPEALGRAMGRVLAHELYHIFADTKHHAAGGIAKSAYTVRELLSNDFHFMDKEAQTLRTSKVHTALENAAAADSSK